MSDSSTTTESTIPAIEVALVAPRLAVCMAISSAYHRSETTHAGRIDLIALAVCASWPSPQPWTRGVIASVAQAEASLRVAQEGAARAAPDETASAVADVRAAQRTLARALTDQDSSIITGESPHADSTRAPDALRIAGVSPAHWLPLGRDLIDRWTVAYGLDSRYTLLPPVSSSAGGVVVAPAVTRRSGA